MSDEANYDAAYKAVIDEMGEAAKRFKAQRYAPKKVATAPTPNEQPEGEVDTGMPTASELESLLNG